MLLDTLENLFSFKFSDAKQTENLVKIEAKVSAVEDPQTLFSQPLPGHNRGQQ